VLGEGLPPRCRGVWGCGGWGRLLPPTPSLLGGVRRGDTPYPLLLCRLLARHGSKGEGVVMVPGHQHGSSIKNPRVYEALKREGMSKTRAAKISNAAVGKGKGKGKGRGKRGR